jgi:N-acetylglucosaminyl-diphospho-decaprenol L-rhamnosyltransferase
MSDLTVATVSYRSADRVAALLSSLKASTIPIPRLIVANNAVDDDAIRDLAAAETQVEVVETGANLGYGGAMNAAIRERPSTSRWILLINPDLRFEPDAIERMLATGDSEPDIGVVGPLIMTPHGEVYPSARRLPSLRTGVGHALFSRLWPGNPWTHAYLSDREDPPRRRDAGWLSGSCLLVRRKAFDAVDGFDESYFMYFEDVDLGARIARAGWRLVYEPDAVIHHEGGHSTSTAARKMVIAHHRSAYLYLSRKYRAWYLWPVRVTLRVGLAIRGRFAKS